MNQNEDAEVAVGTRPHERNDALPKGGTIGRGTTVPDELLTLQFALCHIPGPNPPVVSDERSRPSLQRTLLVERFWGYAGSRAARLASRAETEHLAGLMMLSYGTGLSDATAIMLGGASPPRPRPFSWFISPSS